MRSSNTTGVRAVLLGAVLTSVACNDKSPEKCDQAVSAVRQAVKVEDLALARQWRDYAWKHCADTAALGALDQEVVNTQTAIGQRKVAEEQRAQRKKQLLALFSSWVGQNRSTPARASAAPQCEPPAAAPTQPAKAGTESKERWCQGNRDIAGGGKLSVRYWEAEPEAAVFRARSEEPVRCDDLGPHTVVRAWEVPASGGRSAKRTHCELTGGALAGLHAVVSEAQNAELQVFSPQYLQRDASLRLQVEGR
jgi:hypothetical protein